jgi:hypothetical protein
MAWTNKDEIEVVEWWEIVWWDLKRDTTFNGSLTGTLPSIEQRRIQHIYGKEVHKGCGGDLTVSHTGECEGKFAFPVQCLKCGKIFCAEVG